MGCRWRSTRDPDDPPTRPGAREASALVGVVDVPDLVYVDDTSPVDGPLPTGHDPDRTAVLCNGESLAIRLRRLGVSHTTPEAYLPPEAVRARMDEFARGVASFEHGPSTSHEGVPLERLFCFLANSFVLEALRSWAVARAVVDALAPRRITLHMASLERTGHVDINCPEFMYLPDWLSLMGETKGIEVKAPQSLGQTPPQGHGALPRAGGPDLSTIVRTLAWPSRGRKRVAFFNMFRDYETARALAGEMHRRGLHVVHMNEGVRFPATLRHALHLDPLTLVSRSEGREVRQLASSVGERLVASMHEHLSTPFIDDGRESIVDRVMGREVVALAGTVEHLMLVHLGVTKALRLLGPPICFVRADWLPLERMFAHAARAHGSTVVVLQHGVTSETSYNGFAAGPTVADMQFCWGEASRRHQLAHGVGPEKVIVTGSPKYEALVRGEWQVEGRIGPAIEARRKSLGVRAVVLYTSQPSTCQSALDDTTERAQILEELLLTLGSKKDVLLVLKPHPAEDPSFYHTRLADHRLGNVEVMSGRAWEAINASDVVVTHSSGTGLEAILLGRPVLQVQTTRRQPHLPLAELGAAVPVRSVEDYERLYEGHLRTGTFGEMARQCDPARFLREYLDGAGGTSAAKVVDATMGLMARGGDAGGGGPE